MHNNPLITFQVICLCNGAGPTIWFAVSAPLIEIMKGAGHGIKFEAPLSQYKDSLVGFTFVDDTGIVEGNLANYEITIEYVYISMQKAIIRW